MQSQSAIQSVPGPQRSDAEIQQLWLELREVLAQDDAKKITELMTGVSEQEKAQLLKVTNSEGSNLFHIAANFSRNSCFRTFFDFFPIDARNQAMAVQDKMGNTVFFNAVCFLPSDIFRLLIEKTDSEVVTYALSLTNTYGKTILTQAIMRRQPDDIFCLLVEKSDAKAINEILLSKNKTDGAVLHAVATCNLGDPFRLLIEKADAKVISQVLALQDDEKETVLHLAAWKQPGDVFRRLIEKADKQSIDQALSLQNTHEETVLDVAACYQSSDAFADLIKRCSPKALSQACRLYKKGQSVLESALSYQQPSVIAELLNVIDDDALRAMLKAPNIPSRLLAAVAGCLGHRRGFQTHPLVGRLFALAGPQLADYCTKLWLAGKFLPPTVVQAALPHFERLIQTQPQRASELEAIAGIFSKEEKSERKEEAIRLKSGEVLELKDAEKAQEVLWQQGLHSFYDYHLLKQLYPGSQLAQTADDLYYLGLLLKGCPLPFEPTKIDPRLAETNAKGEVLFKTIKPKDWPDFVKQMSDYSYRANLRNPEHDNDKPEAKAKYVHLLGEIVEYEFHKDKKKEPYEQTIKQSVSLLSNNYDTAVFGEHDPNRQLVGLLFSREFCVIKAMMLKDLGTFYRKWVGSKENVEKYAKEMKDINVTDFEKFKEEVAKNPQRLNEMLVKLSRKAMLGVVMATDTPDARKQAKTYQKDILDELKIDLPIYFYDRALRMMRLYTPREQEDDLKLEERWSLLYTAIFKDDAEEIAKLMTGVSESEKEKLLKYTSAGGVNLLFAAASKAKISFVAFFNLFSVDIRNPALLLPDNYGWTAIHAAASVQSGDAFRHLLENSNVNLNEILPLQTGDGSSVLYQAAWFQPGDVFRALIDKTDAKILNQTLLLQDKNGESALLVAAIKQPGDVFCYLLEKINEHTLTQVLSLQDKRSQTVLYAAAVRQSSEIFVKLIERCSAPRSNALNKACYCYTKKGESILESVLPYQPPDVIAKLLNAIDDDALQKMLHAPNIPPRLFDAIASYVGHEASFQTEPLLSRLANLMGPKLADYCTRLLLAGKPLPPTVIQVVLPSFKEFIKEDKAESKEGVIIKLHSGEKLFLPKEVKDEERIAKIIWKKGLQSRYDYHLLKKHFPNSLMAKTADLLSPADLLYRGCYLPFNPADIVPKEVQANLQGDLLAKFIKRGDWLDFKKQMTDYTYRANLRDLLPAQDKSKATEKFVHMQGKTLSEMDKKYENHLDKKKAPYEHTVKQSTTLISKNYNTTHNAYDHPVGLLFNKEHCILKAMLLGDTDTTNRQWVGSKKEVEKYAKEIKEMNYTDFNAFKKAVEENPQKLNQVLAKLSHKAMLGVVCVSDAPEARRLAREYQTDIQKEFKVDLPIYFYDCALHSMRLYTLREQSDDAYACMRYNPYSSWYNSLYDQDLKLREKSTERLQEKLGNMPSNEQGFIEMLEVYHMFERDKPLKPKLLWYQTLWKLGDVSREVNLSATVKMMALLGGEKREFTEREFDALKSGCLGKIMAGMEDKKILPDEFQRQKKAYEVRARF